MPPKASGRDRSLRVTLSGDELAKLHAIADEQGVTASVIVRGFIRDAYRDRFGMKRLKPHPRSR